MRFERGMEMKIDLNSDLGESFGAYTIGRDEEVLSYVSSANVACGFHAGDPTVMLHTVRLAKERGVSIGAHPGLPDLMGFGRRKMVISPEDAYTMMVYQVGALMAIAHAEGVKLVHVKPHGALYNMAAKDSALAEAIAKAVHDVDEGLVLYGLAGSEIIKAGEKEGLMTGSEVFADRTYQPDGSLTPRGQAGAMITDEEKSLAQVLSMVKDGKVTALDGTVISVKAETICVHGDGPKALAFTKKIRETLEKEGIAIEPLKM